VLGRQRAEVLGRQRAEVLGRQRAEVLGRQRAASVVLFCAASVVLFCAASVVLFCAALVVLFCAALVVLFCAALVVLFCAALVVWLPGSSVVSFVGPPQSRRRRDPPSGARSGGTMDIRCGAIVFGAVVEQPPMLTVTSSHRRDLSANWHELPARLLAGAPAVRADRKGDLIAGATVFARATDDMACHEQERGVIIEAAPTAAPELVHGFAKEGEGLACHFEAEHMALKLATTGSRWPVAHRLASNEGLELVYGFASRCFEPGKLTFGNRDASELASARPMELSSVERSGG
jgi:hypothetical protein